MLIYILQTDLMYVTLPMMQKLVAEQGILITESNRHASARSSVLPLLIFVNATTAHTVMCFAILIAPLVKWKSCRYSSL